MINKRKIHSASFKSKVAFEAAKGLKTMHGLASEYEVHPNQISLWKKQLKEGMIGIFNKKRGKSNPHGEGVESKLYEEIGRLKMEVEWLKKKQPTWLKRELIEPEHGGLSIRRQCKLLGLNRSSYYYSPAQENVENLDLMKQIDAEYTRHPFYGSRRMKDILVRAGHDVNRKRVQRLMRLMGIEAIYPKPKTTVRNSEHKIYPYLLRDVLIDHPNQVWSTDITYIPMNNGFMYLVAVIDWYSRYVLSWEISNTLDTEFCLDALEKALRGKKPEIFNTDQGVQFTSQVFTRRLEMEKIRISMDGRGRALDNIFVERLWRSVKYEDIYLKDYLTGMELYQGMDEYFSFYNGERPHQSLKSKTPAEVHFS